MLFCWLGACHGTEVPAGFCHGAGGLLFACHCGLPVGGRHGVPLGVGQSQGPALGGECILGPCPVGVRQGGRAHGHGRVPDRLGTVPGPAVVAGLPEKHTVAAFVSFVVINLVVGSKVGQLAVLVRVGRG
jgi:hypothetical protein